MRKKRPFNFTIRAILCFTIQPKSYARPPRQKYENCAGQKSTTAETLKPNPRAVDNNAGNWVSDQDAKCGTKRIHAQSPSNSAHIVRDADDCTWLQTDKGARESAIQQCPDHQSTERMVHGHPAESQNTSYYCAY